MARPRKIGLEYFPFDIDFFQDEKIVCIAGEFGLKGEMVAIRLLCAIYREGYFTLWNEQLKYKLAKELIGVSAECIEQVVQRLVKWGFFEKSLFDSAKVLTSRGIQQRYFDAVSRRTQTSDLPYILGPKPFMYTKTPVSATKTRVNVAETPLKKSKYKSNIDILPKAAKPPDASPPTESPSMMSIITELKHSRQWIESVCLKHSLNPDEVKTQLDSFALDCKCKEISHTDRQSLLRHFTNWLHYELTRLKEKKNDNSQPDRFSRRRGIDPSDRAPSEYSDTL